jgi:hypothetical protein
VPNFHRHGCDEASWFFISIIFMSIAMLIATVPTTAAGEELNRKP